MKRQQKLLMIQFGLAHEGEVISEEALQAYLRYFEKTMTDDDLAVCLAMFGWTPEALPLAGVEGDDFVV